MKIIATYEDTTENMNAFAETVGYPLNVLNDEGVEVPNVQTIQEFLTAWTTRNLENIITAPTKRKYKQEAINQAQETTEAIEKAVKNNLIVNVE